MSRTKKTPNARRDADLSLIQQISYRAVGLYARHGIRVEYQTIMIGMTSCHFGPQRLRLEALLVADDFNFMHDVGGINRHLDIATDTLTDCFSPRFSWRDQDGNASGYDRVPEEVRGLI